MRFTNEPKSHRAKELVHGFTLLELLIYVAILSVVGIFIGNTFISLAKGRIANDTRTIIDSELRFVAEKIKQDIKAATALTTPSSGNTATSLVITSGGSTITYDLSSDQIRRKVDAGSATPITSSNVKVNSITFENYQNQNASLVQIIYSIKTTISATYNSTNPDRQYTLTKSFTTAFEKSLNPPSRGGGI